MKRNRLPYLFLPILTILLEALPYGAVLVFAQPAEDGTIGYFRKLYPYFSLMPFGYANFAPLITAIASCIILLLLLVYCAVGKKALLVHGRNLTGFAAVVSLCPILYGIRCYSLVGLLISITLIAEFLLLHKKLRTHE